ncbi:amidohydrolase [Microbacterium sp. VKM Ac-2923]|uniref:amidohydrolase family protein n=1 Tax=Microbacterium sp. VKM Ac-2923 TaxID=2929476 RepID=UPI001FB1FA56|nr:amidohydrolase family protein [Microbacterium sp. VKM Ac-2923]MCJ1708816.1 amidohydrolase family protein [Microbacterium sp. VKM Ac-2923]
MTGPQPPSPASAVVLDTHLHLWDPALLPYPWLEGELDRRFGPEEYQAAWAGASTPTASVFVQAECDPSRAHDEVAWVASVAEGCGVRGIVAYAPLERGRRAGDDLDRLRAEPLVVGVRRSLQGEVAGFAQRPDFVAGARLLAERGLPFDACVRPSQLPDVTALADAVPELAIVLDHLGKPAVGSARRPIDPRGSDWHLDLADLAQRSSVHVKISGLPAEAEGPWSVAQVEPFFDLALEAFGPERLLYGGDWPVSERAHPHRWLEAVDAWALDRLGAAGRNAVLARNGEGFYFSARGRSLSPETPPSTSRTTPVVDPDSGLTR